MSDRVEFGAVVDGFRDAGFLEVGGAAPFAEVTASGGEQDVSFLVPTEELGEWNGASVRVTVERVKG